MVAEIRQSAWNIAQDEAVILYVGIQDIIEGAIPLGDGADQRDPTLWTEPWLIVESLQNLLDLFDDVKDSSRPFRVALGDVYVYRSNPETSPRFEIVGVDREHNRGIAPSVCIRDTAAGVHHWLSLARLIRDYDLVPKESASVSEDS